MSGNRSEHDQPEDFSLVLGGPLFRTLLRNRLITTEHGLLKRRIAFFVLITWLPLLLLSAIEGHAWGKVEIPFLLDLVPYTRFFIALPLLIIAELTVHLRLRPAFMQFRNRGLLTPEDDSRFTEITASAERWRNSLLAEVLLWIVSCTLGVWIWREGTVVPVSTWYASPMAGKLHLTFAGWWYALISSCVFRFLLLRWYYRLVIWYRLLWKVSRLRLQLNSLHPDRAGGLGFLGEGTLAFTPLLLAHTVIVSGLIAERIWHEGVALPAFKLELAAILLILELIILLPLSFFAFQLRQTRAMGLTQYGALASRYVAEFTRKWINPETLPTEALVGSADIQSLADLGNSFDVAREMSAVPISTKNVVQLAIMTSLPLAPLLLTMMPLEAVVDRLLKVVF